MLGPLMMPFAREGGVPMLGPLTLDPVPVGVADGAGVAVSGCVSVTVPVDVRVRTAA